VPEPTGLVNFTNEDIADDFAPTGKFGTAPTPKPARKSFTPTVVDELDDALSTGLAADYDDWRNKNLSNSVQSLEDAQRSYQRSSRLREIFGSADEPLERSVGSTTTSELDFGEEFGVAKYADTDAAPAIKVGTPVDDLTKVVSTTAPVTPPVATAADMAASIDARVTAAVVDGGASTASNVVSSGVKRASTAISGLQPKSAGGVLGLGLALAAGGAGVLYMHKNRGRTDYRGA